MVRLGEALDAMRASVAGFLQHNQTPKLAGDAGGVRALSVFMTSACKSVGRYIVVLAASFLSKMPVASKRGSEKHYKYKS
jgi:hypothetical protein